MVTSHKRHPFRGFWGCIRIVAIAATVSCAKAPNVFDAGIADPGGFQKAKWGMTAEQLLAAFPGSHQAQNDAGWDTVQLADFRIPGGTGSLVLQLDNKELYRAMVWGNERFRCDELASLLATKYGDGGVDAGVWLVGVTRIELDCKGWGSEDGNDCSATLTYESVPRSKRMHDRERERALEQL